MKRLLLALLHMSIVLSGFSQDKPRKIVKIDGKKFYSDEFMYLYKKNNSSENKESIDEYLNRFIDYKLKLTEAMRLQLDTAANFKKELAGYKKQVTSAHLVENWVLDSLVSLTYQRMQREVEVQHLFIQVPQEDHDEDKYANKADSLYKAIQKGADFSQLVVAHSNEPKAIERQGKLGFVVASKLPFVFETKIFETPVGSCTKPFRSPGGYHIFKILSDRKARGQRRVAHIFKFNPKDSVSAANYNDSLQQIKKLLKEGVDFAKISEDYSDDESTKGKGGEMPWFATGEMLPEIEDAAFAMKDTGEIAGPIKSKYGVHFLKLIGRKPIEKFEVLKYSLRTKIELSSRMHEGTNYFMNKLRGKFGFEQLAPVSDFYAVVTDSIFVGKWQAELAQSLTKPFFKLGDKTYNQSSFAAYLQEKQRPMRFIPIATYVDDMYENYVNGLVRAYANAHVLEQHPKLERLLEEYHDGILIFELLQQQVWDKAQTDTLGLQNYYQAHKEKYRWDKRAEVSVLQANGPETLTRVDAFFQKNPSGSLDELQKAMQAKNDSLTLLHRRKYTKEDDEAVAKLMAAAAKENPLHVSTNPNKALVYFLHGILPAAPKAFSETKGMVMADYQDELEKQWVNTLRDKYKVKVYRRTVKKLKKRTQGN